MQVTRETIYRLIVVNDCGCQSQREFKDPQYKIPSTECVFTPCDKHKSKSEDVREVLAMMTNQMLNREAENTPAPPPLVRNNPVNAPAPTQDGITVTQGSSTMVGTGGPTQTFKMPNLPKKNASDILTPKTPSVSRSGPVKSTKLASKPTATVAAVVEDGIEIGGIQMEEMEENEGLTNFIENGGLFGDIESDPDNSAM